jgi:hypothetical protein
MIKYKTKQVEERASGISKVLFSILIEMGYFCKARGHDFVVTATLSTPEEDQKLGRKSASHREGRAADIRTRDWPEAFLKTFIEEFEGKFGDYGAVSASDGKRRFLIDKSKTTSPHIHAQLSRDYSVDTKE